MGSATGPNTAKGPEMLTASTVLMFCAKDTHFVEWASEKWDHTCKAMTKSLFPGARTSLYLAVSPTTRKETNKKSEKWPKSLVLRGSQWNSSTEVRGLLLHPSQEVIQFMFPWTGISVYLEKE